MMTRLEKGASQLSVVVDFAVEHDDESSGLR